MPISMQIDRMNREVVSRLGAGFAVISTDLYSLEGTERDEAIDAVVAGEESPFVLIDGHLACTGGLDLDAILGALQAAEAATSTKG
jgi:hypothetical protein